MGCDFLPPSLAMPTGTPPGPSTPRRVMLRRYQCKGTTLAPPPFERGGKEELSAAPCELQLPDPIWRCKCCWRGSPTPPVFADAIFRSDHCQALRLRSAWGSVPKQAMSGLKTPTPRLGFSADFRQRLYTVRQRGVLGEEPRTRAGSGHVCSRGGPGPPHCRAVGGRAKHGTRRPWGPFPHAALPKASRVPGWTPANRGPSEAGHRRQPALLCWDICGEVTPQPVCANGGIAYMTFQVKGLLFR